MKVSVNHFCPNSIISAIFLLLNFLASAQQGLHCFLSTDAEFHFELD